MSTVPPITRAALVNTLLLVLSWHTPAGAQTLRPSEAPRSPVDAVADKRGVDNWSADTILLQPTQAPEGVIKPVPEWADASRVLFAVDDDISGSFQFNATLKTLTNPAAVYGRTPEVLAFLDENVCQSSGSAAGDDWAEYASSDKHCVAGHMRPEVRDAAFRKLELAHDFVSGLKALIPHIPVALIVDGNDETGLTQRDLAANLKAMGLDIAAPDVARRVMLVGEEIASKWIRDYGPQFARGATGGLVLIDARYETSVSVQTPDDVRDMRSLAAMAGAGDASNDAASLFQGLLRGSIGASAKSRGRLDDDVSATRLAAKLRQTPDGSIGALPVSVYRPPIALAGGDFQTDGTIGFISTTTLLANGGNARFVEDALRSYWGIATLVALEPLPGNTVKHIDMFFQVLRPNVLLLGRYDRHPDETPLERSARETLDVNRDIILAAYRRAGRQVEEVEKLPSPLGKATIYLVRMPMAAVARPFVDQFTVIQDELKGEVQQIAELDQRRARIQRVRDFTRRLDESVDGLEQVGKVLGVSAALDSYQFDVIQAVGESVSGLRESLWRLDFVATLPQDTRRALALEGDSLVAECRRLAAREEEKKPLTEAEIDDLVKRLRALLSSREEIDAALTSADQEIDAAQESNAAEVRHWLERLAVLHEISQVTDLYLTHMNFLQVKQDGKTVIILPTYDGLAGKELEASVVQRLEGVFAALGEPLVVIKWRSDPLIRELGAVHCVTKVLPKGVDFAMRP